MQLVLPGQKLPKRNTYANCKNIVKIVSYNRLYHIVRELRSGYTHSMYRNIVKNNSNYLEIDATGILIFSWKKFSND